MLFIPSFCHCNSTLEGFHSRQQAVFRNRLWIETIRDGPKADRPRFRMAVWARAVNLSPVQRSLSKMGRALDLLVHGIPLLSKGLSNGIAGKPIGVFRQLV